MPGARATDLRAVLRFAQRTLDVADVPAVETVPLPGLAALVGGDAATLHETDLGAPRQGWCWDGGRVRSATSW